METGGFAYTPRRQPRESGPIMSVADQGRHQSGAQAVAERRSATGPHGEVSELVDEHDLGSCAERRGSSSLPFPTNRLTP